MRNAAQFGRGTGPVWLAQVGCTLNDTSLSNCSLGIPIGTNNCNHGQDAGIICFTQFSKQSLHRCEMNTFIVYETSQYNIVGNGDTSLSIKDIIIIIIIIIIIDLINTPP